jgi:hypothetical protein
MLSTSVNGCSMKTEAQLEMIKMIPLEKLLLETGTQGSPQEWQYYNIFTFRCTMVFINRRTRVKSLSWHTAAASA